MAHGCVEAGRDDHDVRIKLLGDRHDDRAERCEILRITHGRVQATGPRHVHVIAETLASAAFGGPAGSREEVTVVVSVYRQVQHSRIVVKHLLGAVPMMNVLLQDIKIV